MSAGYGSLSPDGLWWWDGSQWLPVSPAAGTGRPFRSGRGRTLFVCAALCLFALVEVVLIINNVALASRIESLNVGDTLGLGDLQVYGAVGSLAVWPLDAAVLMAVVAFSFWLYRAQANLRALGATELRFSPIFAALSILIPIANLILVLLIVREIYKGSEPELAPNNRSTRAGVRVWRGVWVCWTTLLVGWLLLLVRIAVDTVIKAAGSLSLTGLDDLLWFGVVINSVFVVFAAAGIFVVLGIDWRQRQRHRLLSGGAPETT